MEERQRLERRKREAQANLALEEGKTEPHTLICFIYLVCSIHYNIRKVSHCRCCVLDLTGKEAECHQPLWLRKGLIQRHVKAATCIKEATGKPKTDRTGVNALPSFKASLPYQDQLAIPSHPVLGKLLTNVPRCGICRFQGTHMCIYICILI